MPVPISIEIAQNISCAFIDLLFRSIDLLVLFESLFVLRRHEKKSLLEALGELAENWVIFIFG